ncbi:MAG TPA: hypothetical protein VMB21_11415 [Candidatus Limnocylindria bacterium]|jgi:hypothetical protein|nr:hypothetical protein [Candidatus Limnocylindria bacterium]
MKLRIFFRLLWLTLGLAGCPLVAADTDAAFEAANRLLAQGRAAEAARAYAAISPNGATSAALERNWAQACYQSQQPGPALFHLRRAEQLVPRDESVRADLVLLRRKLGISADPAEELPFLRSLRLDEWAWLALIAVWLWFALLFAAKLSPRLRVAIRGFGVGTGLVALVLCGLLAGAYAEQSQAPDAVVLAGDTPVRQSPLEEAKATFTVPAATELRVRDHKDGWLMVEDAATQRFGWLKATQVGRLGH